MTFFLCQTLKNLFQMVPQCRRFELLYVVSSVNQTSDGIPFIFFRVCNVFIVKSYIRKCVFELHYIIV